MSSPKKKTTKRPQARKRTTTSRGARPLAATTARLFFDRLMELLPDHVYFKDRAGRFLRVNMAHAASFGLSSPAEIVGKSDYDFFDASLARQKDADEREIVRTGLGFVGKEERSGLKSGRDRWVLTSKLPLVGDDGEIIGTFGISRDISDMKQARESLEEQHRLLKTLIEILPCRIFVKDREGRIRLLNEAYRQAIGVASAAEAEGRLLSELVQDERTRSSAADDRAVLEEGREILNREEFNASPIGDQRWMLLSKVPLRDGDGNVQGIVGMAADITAQKDAEARAVEAQHALEEKNREIEAELELARELQTELMTSGFQSVRDALDRDAPLLPQIAFHYEPSTHLAGDFFHLIPLSSRSFGLLLCDVMGHGVKAALVTTLIRGLLANVKAREMRPAQVLDLLNDRLCPLLDRPPLPRFVTALYASVDIDEGRVSLASAGHPWPLLRSGKRNVRPIATEACGPALGLIPGATFGAAERTLARGDRVLFFTDGWTEERNPAGEEFGPERFAALFGRSNAQTPEAALAEMSTKLRTFAKKTTHSDDVCAVLVDF